MLRIERLANGQVGFTLSGRIQTEDIEQFQQLLVVESAGIIPVRMPSDPRFDLALQVRRHWNEIVALIRFCVTNPIFPSLTFLESFIDSELGTLEIFNAQDQNLAGCGKTVSL